MFCCIGQPCFPGLSVLLGCDGMDSSLFARGSAMASRSVLGRLFVLVLLLLLELLLLSKRDQRENEE